MAIQKIGKWGPSMGIRIPKEIYEALGLDYNDEIVFIQKDKDRYELIKKADDTKIRVWYTKDSENFEYLDTKSVDEGIGMLKAIDKLMSETGIMASGMQYFDKTTDSWREWHDDVGNDIYHYVYGD